MPSPQPQTSSKQISDLLMILALDAGSHDAVRARSFEVLRACDQLQKVDVVSASVLKSNLYAMMGDAEKCSYWSANVLKNGGRNRMYEYAATNLLLLGKVSEAYQAFKQSIELKIDSPTYYAKKSLVTGWFRLGAEFISRAEIVEFTEQQISELRDGALVLDELGVNDLTFNRLMDCAHGLLVEEKLIWLGSSPNFRILRSDQDGPAMFITYRISTSPAVAADLSWQLAMRLVENDLDNVGISISFEGVDLLSSESIAESNLIDA